MRQDSQPVLSTPSLFAESAGRWFLESGIQESSGGVARYYCSDIGKNKAVSTEITGYAAKFLVYAGECIEEPGYLDAAVQAGTFLSRTAWDAELEIFPFGLPGNRRAYFFDSGIIVRGLLALWRATGETEFLEKAEAGGRSMARDFGKGGKKSPIIALPGKRPVPRSDGWSRNPGCYQLKSALAWQELYEATGDENFRDPYEAVLEYALESHADFLPGHKDREGVMDRLHPYCYFLEGLLPVLGRPACAAAMAEGIARAGGYLHSIAPVFQRSDACAQLLRVRLFADRCGIAALDRTAAETEQAAIAGFQMESSDPRIDGGFCFGRKAGELMPFINPVSAAFCAQSLEMWRQYLAGAFLANWQSLI